MISALGLAMIAAFVPQYMMGFILGMWFLTQATAYLLGGHVATFTAHLKVLPIHYKHCLFILMCLAKSVSLP